MDEMPGMIRPDLQALPQVKDRMTFLYLEHCTLGRQDGAITVTKEKGGLPPPRGDIRVRWVGRAPPPGPNPPPNGGGGGGGGDSGPSVRPPRKESFSPHMRGGSHLPVALELQVVLFPAYAGVIPALPAWRTLRRPFPRICGGNSDSSRTPSVLRGGRASEYRQARRARADL